MKHARVILIAVRLLDLFRKPKPRLVALPVPVRK